MVTGYTATEYGDIMVARLQQPYYNVEKILGYDIVVGIKNEYMTGTISTEAGSNEIDGTLTQFNSVFSSGDTIIIGNVKYTIDQVLSQTEITLVETLDFTLTGLKYYRQEDPSNNFEYMYRWSQDNTVYSEWHPLNEGLSYGDIKTLGFDTTKPLWIDTRLEVNAISTGNSLTLLSINYTTLTVDGEIEECPSYSGGGDGGGGDDECDPFASDGLANIRVECEDSGNLFNPYILGKASQVNKQLVNMVSDIFGHEVKYFRTEPDLRTSDVILMEYSLHNVVDKQDVKILVPDNEFPTEANTYDIFGIEYAEFEVHITADEFQKVFGYGKTPRSKDYMWIPIMGKMYEISSVSIADEFNLSSSYWRVMLVKYQDRTSVIKNEFEAETDGLITGVEEIFGEQQKEEYEKDTNPQQFQTVSTSYRDGIREFVDTHLKIVDHDLKNRWTVVSKNYYDLTVGEIDDNAIFYQEQSKLDINDNMALTGWFSPQFASDSTHEYFLFGDVAAVDGFKMKLSNSVFKIELSGIADILPHGITFNKNEWYAYVVNMNNSFVQMSVSIYRLDPASNIGRPQDSTNNLELMYNNVIDLTAQNTWNTSSKFALRFNDMYMTNIRVFNAPIEEEQHSNILNQYVVRDNNKSIIIDNAIPSLGFQKFVNSK